MKPTRKRFGEPVSADLLFLSLLITFVYTSWAGAQVPSTFMPTSDMATPSISHTVTLQNGAVLIPSDDEFRQAIKVLGGTQTVVDFDELDARPITNTYLDHRKFDGNTYANLGVTFASLGKDLYIAPGGLFWNATNSLSVFRFPFDRAPGDDIDSLDVRLTAQGHAPCVAAGFTRVDLDSNQNKYVRFLDSNGGVVAQTSFPVPAAYVFLGIISVDRPIAKIEIVEGTESDDDDVDYDDFICVRAQASGTFARTGNMTAARAFATATLLPNGKVLIVSRAIASAELYDPETGMFTSVGNIIAPWSSFTATLLGDGKVLIVGKDGTNKNSAYLYDPTAQTFTFAGSTVTGQLGGWATLLRNGKVLIAGGVAGKSSDGRAQIANPELYDPSSGTFTATGAFATTGSTPDVTGGPETSAVSLLPDGRVLFAGEPNSEIYDPVSGSFRLTGPMTTPCFIGGGLKPTYIGGRTATLLPNGKVLLTGGEHEDCGRFANAELYDAFTGTFIPTGDMTRARDNHTATLLSDGTVLIAGGESQECNNGGCIFSGTTASAESYDPSTGTFATAGDMTASRGGQMATLLQNGTVLIAGGYAYGETGAEIRPCIVCVSYLGSLNSAELYTPPALAPILIVTNLQFDRTSINAGDSYSTNVSGSNLIEQTFFDVRFRVPGSTLDQEVLNWQRGTSGSHMVPLGTASGIWTITSVRAHQIETDHTGSFVPVSARITVSP